MTTVAEEQVLATPAVGARGGGVNNARVGGRVESNERAGNGTDNVTILLVLGFKFLLSVMTGHTETVRPPPARGPIQRRWWNAAEEQVLMTPAIGAQGGGGGEQCQSRGQR
jgi:hypothetical protein